MNNPCAKCPCPEICLGWRIFCDWTEEDPPDEVKLKHICGRSALGERPAQYPSLATQAGNALKAAGRVIAAAVKGGPIKVPPPVYYERLEICRGCEFNGERPAGVRCMKCGCGGIKLEFATEKCPIDKWPTWES